MPNKEKSPAFQFYPKDFLTDPKVITMSDEETGIYIRMLSHDWLEDGLSPEMVEYFRKKDSGSRVVDKCFQPHPNRPGFLTNHRLLKEREKQLEWSQKSSEGGKKSAEAKQNQRFKESKGGIDLVTTISQPMVNSSSSSSSSNINTPPAPSKKESSWPPEGDELRPNVFITKEQQAMLAKAMGSKEVIYWLGELGMAAAQNPVKWKKKYKNHFLVIRQWRRMRMESGKVWNDSQALYCFPPKGFHGSGGNNGSNGANRPFKGTYQAEPSSVLQEVTTVLIESAIPKVNL